MAGPSAALTQRLEELDRARPGARQWIEPWLRDGSDEEVFRVSPTRWADSRGLDLDTAVDYLLHAAHVGLVRLGWELNCPGCGLTIDSVERLDAIGGHFDCPVCEKSQDLALDDWIQVTVSVRPDVRPVRYHDPAKLTLREQIIHLEAGAGVVMKSGEPLAEYLDRRLLFVEEVAPGASHRVRFDATTGVLLTCPTDAVMIRGDEQQSSRIDVRLGDDGRLAGLPERVPPGNVELTVRNDTAKTPRVWMFVAEDFYQFGPPAGYTAAQLIHHPSYARLFPSQLACSGCLTIRDVTLLFSDLVRSTAMYRELGDLRAYERVREHFTAIAPVIERHHGLWIKDIGDAVMASFADPDEAIRAAIEMQQAVRALGDLELKIGVHCGGCIGVESHGRLDWFGSTVNLAARVQSTAGPGELCVSDAAYQRAADVLSGYATSAFETRVRGIDEPTRIHRVAVPTAGSAAPSS